MAASGAPPRASASTALAAGGADEGPVAFPEPTHYETHSLAWYLHASAQVVLDLLGIRAQQVADSAESLPASNDGGQKAAVGRAQGIEDGSLSDTVASLQRTALRIVDDYVRDLQVYRRVARSLKQQRQLLRRKISVTVAVS